VTDPRLGRKPPEAASRHRYAMAVILSSAAPSTLTPLARAQRRRQAPPPRRRSGGLHGGLARLSTALILAHGAVAAGAARALPSYEETLRLGSDSGDGGDAFSVPDISLDGLSLPDLGLQGLVDFVTENPVVVAASVAGIALPLVLARVLGGGGGFKPYSVVSARAAYQRLFEEPDAQLVDIRLLKDARQAGAPDLREVKKKAVAVPYNGEDKNGFLKKLALRFKDPENTKLIILDK
jgi:chitinase domain-containing protein 1